mmetsp:Transcript_9322/g.23084  ORF Transcript_9322/g.23084 Transcript_9322/m.23084 type:complete len:220 (-) Transcript_9322:426-1085(-)
MVRAQLHRALRHHAGHGEQRGVRARCAAQRLSQPQVQLRVARLSTVHRGKQVLQQLDCGLVVALARDGVQRLPRQRHDVLGVHRQDAVDGVVGLLPVAHGQQQARLLHQRGHEPGEAHSHLGQPLQRARQVVAHLRHLGAAQHGLQVIGVSCQCCLKGGSGLLQLAVIHQGAILLVCMLPKDHPAQQHQRLPIVWLHAQHTLRQAARTLLALGQAVEGR